MPVSRRRTTPQDVRYSAQRRRRQERREQAAFARLKPTTAIDTWMPRDSARRRAAESFAALPWETL